MTSVYIDGSSLDFSDTEGNSTLADLVGVVEQEIKPIRRYVDSISVDGETFDGWRAPSGLNRALGSFGEVKLQTASFDEVGAEAVAMLREYSGVIKGNIDVCAGSLRKGGAAGAEFASVIEGVIELVKTIEMLAKGSGSYGVPLFGGDPFEFCSTLLDSLDELKEAGAATDSVSLADILEYELGATLDGVERLTAVV